ncbi:MAG: NAD(+)/NADH kinase [Candidatus Riflebacteria bacterium]|nr:NAD(+)/NADH kinase [Candidatus Riflebacteria bacterium]
MHNPVKRLALICHPTRENAPGLVRLILEWAREHCVEIRMEPAMARQIGCEELSFARRDMLDKVDLALVLGGDGSILETVRAFAKSNIPVAGINLGHLGFLTLGSNGDTIMILERLLEGNYEVEDRGMIQVVVKRQGEEVYTNIALNDFAIVKEPISRVIEVELSISGTYVTSFRGDGVIFATPTGSTAYSLSAGGPIVPPWVNAMLLCPIASHTLSARPVITSDQEVINAILHCTHSQVDLVTDGQEGFRIQDGDVIEVTRAPDFARIVVLHKRSFFEVLREKMKWGK